MHPDLGKGGAGISEALGGVTLRELLSNHQDVITSNVSILNETIQQITIDGANVQATGDYFEAVNGQTVFGPLAAEPLGQVEVRVNGATQLLGVDFEIVGGPGARSIHWISPDFSLDNGDIVLAFYLKTIA